MRKKRLTIDTSPFDLTDEQWEIVAPLIPPCTPITRPHPGRPAHSRPDPGGRPLIPDRPILNGILWKLRTGIPWYSLPESYPSFQTCYRRYSAWVEAGAMQRILRALASDLAERAGIDLSECLHLPSLQVQDRSALFSLLHRPGMQSTWQVSTLLLLIASRREVND
jgi:transposase